MPLISVITPTFRREDLLARCVESVLSQQVEGAQIEHIVVNDAGEPLTHASWMDDPRVQVVTTKRVERAFVRNTGAALSGGDYLYFLDDDDYPLPGAFQALLKAAQDTPDAVHIYGAYEIFDETEQQLSTISPDVEGFLYPLLLTGAMIPLQASWIRRDAYLRSGGYQASFVPADDAYFLQHICRQGRTARTDAVVCRVRVNHNKASILNAQREAMRRMPEYWTGMPDTFSLLQKQVRGRPGWAGGCARLYLKAAVRAAQRGNPALAFSRLCLTGRMTLAHAGSRGFWTGLRGRA